MVSTQIARFEPVQVDGRWTVVDLLTGQVMEPRRAWDEAAAVVAAEALNEAPNYVVHWPWVPAGREATA
jgi:hypothetical protein